MEITEKKEPTFRNFNTISPSAKSLCLMKGLTNIPFARQAAEFITSHENSSPDFGPGDTHFWARVAHFESRYLSIDQLLGGLPIKNILELSSGFSFRCLEAVRRGGIHYIDTDLPEMIKIKKEIIIALQGEDVNRDSKLEIMPLNALDEEQFHELVGRFPEGEIAILNEGLLMYLDTDEKERLCSIIRNILKKRGGYWITADIYIKKRHVGPDDIDGSKKEFFKQHRIEDNKFESFKAAEAFFTKAGFIIDKVSQADRSKLSSLHHLRKSANVWRLYKMRRADKSRATWRLRVAAE